MAYLDRADLVRRLKLRLARPTSDESFTVTTTGDVYDDFLTEAQDRLNKLLGTYVPDAVWTIPTAITSSDSGETFTFGTDVDGAAVFAFGHFQVFESEEAIPDYPLTPGVDFTVEGTKLRIPNNGSRTGSLWVQYAAPSNVIGSASEPTVPKVARMALLVDAERRCWEKIGRDDKAVDAEARFQSEWFAVVSLIQTRANQRGGLPIAKRPRSSFRNMHL